jgi:hypothetical protein
MLLANLHSPQAHSNGDTSEGSLQALEILPPLPLTVKTLEIPQDSGQIPTEPPRMLQGLDSPQAYHEIYSDSPATQGNQGPEGEDPRFGLLESDK